MDPNQHRGLPPSSSALGGDLRGHQWGDKGCPHLMFSGWESTLTASSTFLSSHPKQRGKVQPSEIPAWSWALPAPLMLMLV